LTSTPGLFAIMQRGPVALCKTIKQKVKFRASPERIFRLLVDSKMHAALTGEKATIGRRVGDAFSTRNGHVSGIIVDLVPGERVVQAWRTRDFPVGIFSMATFQLCGTEDGGTELVLTHRGVPKHLIPAIEQDWRESCWGPIKERVGGGGA
jgi:uncharacterized protein YndB with AHSA1/START domain